MHIAVQTRYDLAYACMRLSGYMCAPTLPAFQVLHQAMEYLYHHPHVPIMYPRKPLCRKRQLECHFKRGTAEYKTNPYISFIDNYNDGDLARDLRDRRSVTSTVHLFNGVIVDWQSKKQRDSTANTSGSETRSLYHGMQRSNIIRNLCTTIGYGIGEPTATYKDNKATIQSVLADRITPAARSIDVLITSLHDHHSCGRFALQYCRSDMQHADTNSKPLGGAQLRENVRKVIGAKYYPPPDSDHHRLLFPQKNNS